MNHRLALQCFEWVEGGIRVRFHVAEVRSAFVRWESPLQKAPQFSCTMPLEKPDKIKSISNNTLAKRRLERQSGIAFSIPEFTTPNAVRPAVTPYIGMARTLLIML
ncbi:hypothetical protein IMCC26134_05020 [Verrucomicrobia bacterium IMCC26134]|nr:hypothetical protein IMCC26134_05020 [Verrucomicrobia bacterium IMCC26134]